MDAGSTFCPTGAAAYALPPSDGLLQKLRVLLSPDREAGGEQPVILFLAS